MPHLLLATVLSSGALAFACACAETPSSDLHEMNADTFRKHFANQNACVNYVEKIVHPAAPDLSRLHSIREMRAWIDAHQNDKFAQLARAVQRSTERVGALDPRKEKDQLAVTSEILPAMRKLQGFDASHCGPNVRDILIESIYKNIGGNDAPVFAEVKRLGVADISEGKWVLLVALLAHSLDEVVER